MIELAPNPILEFNSRQLKEIRELFGYEDLNRLRQDIDLLKHWIQKQEHFVIKEYDEAYLERQLVCSKGSIERAKKRLDKLCTLRGLMPEYLKDFDVKNEFQNLLKVSNTCLLPKPTPDHYRILFLGFYNSDSTMFESLQEARYLSLLVEYLFCYDYNAGIEFIADTKNITLGMVSKLNPIVISNSFMVINEALGLRMKGIHIISGSKFLDTILTIIKQGLSKKLTSRLHVHDNYEALLKFVPREVLPKDIGGDLPVTLKELRENNFKELSSPDFIEKLEFIGRATTNETKRLNCEFNEAYSGMPGSFKVLNVD